MKRISKFCIALSAAVLLTGGLASANDDNMPNHWGNHGNLHSGFFAELNKLASPFQALAEHIRQEEARKARLEQERIAERERRREWQEYLQRVEERQKERRNRPRQNTWY